MATDTNAIEVREDDKVHGVRDDQMAGEISFYREKVEPGDSDFGEVRGCGLSLVHDPRNGASAAVSIGIEARQAPKAIGQMAAAAIDPDPEFPVEIGERVVEIIKATFDFALVPILEGKSKAEAESILFEVVPGTIDAVRSIQRRFGLIK